MHHELIQTFFYVFTGGAVLASLALFGRQPLLLAYIGLGVLIGPHGIGLVSDQSIISQGAEIGIIFLLFLLGLEMHPHKLLTVLREVTQVTLASSFLFGLLGFSVSYAFDFKLLESAIIGSTMMFSSTIIGIKLLPADELHHKHSGELVIGILLIQDFVAIFVLVALLVDPADTSYFTQFAYSLLSLPVLVVFAVIVFQKILRPLFSKFEKIGEYIFLVAIGWCLGMAEASASLGLSREIGAFIAGISMATSNFSEHIALNLKPVRDFFLILFFFSLGSGFELNLMAEIWLISLVMSVLVMAVKPVVLHYLLRSERESNSLSWDIGFRLGQNSEFSLLIAFVASNAGFIDERASHVIQAVSIITFIISSYIIIYNFPSPISAVQEVRHD
jgi:Kef-type K+ transport system membrane component KefB